MRLSLLVGLLVLCGAMSAQAEDPHPNVPPLPITINGRSAHPTVYITAEDFAHARERAAKHLWAKGAVDALFKEADRWTAMDEASILKLIPPPGACFAYGFTGCPVCGGSFAGWWGSKGTASIDDPGHVRCVNGHRLPDDQHPDSGTGWRNPENGRMHYLVGTFNSYAIDSLTTALGKLVLAYGFTGDEKYSRRAALIFDHLARIYPTSETGSVDYPSEVPSGRFNRPWYQVARMLVNYVNAYDILLMGKVLDEPSSVPGLTRRENIEKNLLLNGVHYCYQQAMCTPMLNNGVADYQRGQMAVAAAMGIPQYMKYAVEGPFGFRNMVENNIDRDGQYFETSSGYAVHARMLYLDMADILRDYRDEEHPHGYDIARHPKFHAMLMLSRARLDAGGHLVTLGDDPPPVQRRDPASTTIEHELIELERLASLTGDERAINLISQRSGGDVDSARRQSRHREWLLFHAVDIPAAATQPAEILHPLTNLPLRSSDLLPQRGLAFLRHGDGADAQAATIRTGTTLNHGHWDEMGLNLYAFGFQLTYDIGYVLGSTHAYKGWGRQTASHNLVLVNETSQLKTGISGGSIKQFVQRPGFTLTRADNLACYASEKLKQYDRTVAMIGISEKDCYLLDIFRVQGGHQHDYIFHAMGTNLSTEGVQFGDPEPGSLAGAEIRWGEMLGSDGDITTFPNKPNWNPPPENGLGFLTRARRAMTDAMWSATWKVADDAHLRLNLLPQVSTQAITAEAPGLYPDTSKFPRSAYILARRKGENLSSVYAAIIEPYSTRRVVQKVTALSSEKPEAVGVRVDLPDGRSDYLLQSDSPASWKHGSISLEIDSGTAWIELRENKIQRIVLSGGTSLKIGGVVLRADQPHHIAGVQSVDVKNSIVYVEPALPDEGQWEGEFITFNRPEYAQSSAYRVQRIIREGNRSAIYLSPSTLLLARGHLEQNPSQPGKLPNVVPIEHARSVMRQPSGFFKGKRIETADGRVVTQITDIADKEVREISVKDSEGFRAGDDLLIYDIQSGDQVQLPATVTAEHSENTWKITGGAIVREAP